MDTAIRYEDHPIAAIFPLLDQADLEVLAQDIRSQGLLEPIWVWEGKILDGRNRYRACKIAGVEPRTRAWTGNGDAEAVAFVVSLNAARRHLTSSQKAMVALDAERILAERAKERQRLSPGRPPAPIEKGPQIVGDVFPSPPSPAPRAPTTPRESDGRAGTGLPTVPFPLPPSTRRDGEAARQAAAMVGTNHTYVAAAKEIVQKAPDLAPKVRDGVITIPEAKQLVAMPEEKRTEIVARVEASGGALKVREAARQVKREEVAKVAPLPDSKYRVIYADPPWQYGDNRAGLEGLSQTAAADHYPTMSVAELSTLDVRSLAADDAVLFCWATFPLLPDALEVVRAWGFKYKTAFVWSKGRSNFGHYHTADAELLLVCTRGSGVPDTDKRERQVQSIERTGRHSEKPEEFRQLIDRLYTHGKRIELFRRGEPPAGWEVWGNEALAEAS